MNEQCSQRQCFLWICASSDMGTGHTVNSVYVLSPPSPSNYANALNNAPGAVMINYWQAQLAHANAQCGIEINCRLSLPPITLAHHPIKPVASLENPSCSPSSIPSPPSPSSATLNSYLSFTLSSHATLPSSSPAPLNICLLGISKTPPMACYPPSPTR